jgi:hypothetical protein
MARVKAIAAANFQHFCVWLQDEAREHAALNPQAIVLRRPLPVLIYIMILAVEMEAAALYAFATATSCKVLCLAHVTNTMAQSGADFEKSEDDGNVDALAVLGSAVGALAEKDNLGLLRHAGACACLAGPHAARFIFELFHEKPSELLDTHHAVCGQMLE